MLLPGITYHYHHTKTPKSTVLAINVLKHRLSKFHFPVVKSVPNRNTNIDKHRNTSNMQIRTTVHQGHIFWTCRQKHACEAAQGEKRDQRWQGDMF